MDLVVAVAHRHQVLVAVEENGSTLAQHGLSELVVATKSPMGGGVAEEFGPRVSAIELFVAWGRGDLQS